MMNFKRALLSLSLILLVFGISHAQRKQDVVYLKNGSVIRGSLVEYKPGLHVKIETRDRSVWVFEQDRIEQVTREARKAKLVTPKYHGYYFAVSTGLLPGSGRWGAEVSGFLRMVNGYQFNEKFALGLVTELSGLDSWNGGLMPVALESRYYLTKGRTSPYLMAQAGYSFPLYNETWEGQSMNTGGINLGASIGIRHHFSSSSALDISVGYLFQHTKQNYDRWWNWDPQLGSTSGIDQVTTLNYFNRLAIKIGFLFN